MREDDRERHRQTRERLGLRADPQWVEWVGEHGTVPPMLADIPMTDDEILEFRSRQERATTTIGAFRAARLVSEAGAWLDQRASGVARLLLAHPDARERAVAEGIVAEHGGVVEFVEHSTRELNAVRALVRDEMTRGTPFGQAVTSVRDDVWANAERVTLRGDLHPEVPADIQAAIDDGTLLIEHPTEPWGWGPDPDADTGDTSGAGCAGTAPADDEPVPQWPGDDPTDAWGQLGRCVQYVADRCVGGPLETAERLAEDIGLAVRVIYPGSFRTDDLRGNRVNLHVNAEHIVRRVDAG